ncbi:MAG: DNA recombination protein RmuC [Planctomycetes bacterium]|nr:DNA recombination protein RmuC [Planctomycetota bacterium]
MEWQIFVFIAGILFGGISVWLLLRNSAGNTAGLLQQHALQKDAEISRLQAALDEERTARAKADTLLDETQKNLAEQKKLLDEAAKRLSDAFTALSKTALDSNNKAFLELARTSLQTIIAEAKGDIGKKQEAIDGLIKPINETLKRYEEQVKQLEQSRQKAYGGLEEQLKSLNASQLLLQKETGNLVNALRAPQVRGRWGEITLRKVAELSGMSEHCDFTEQVSVDTEEGRLRPDMIVRLPANRNIVVDSKVALYAYMDAVASVDELTKNDFLKKHAKQVKDHVSQLSSKSYWEQFENSPEFVVMFMPGESFLSAALSMDNTLIEEAIQKKVIIATPTTLVALLKAIAYGWRQEQVEKNAMQICGLGKEMYERMAKFIEHMSKVGSSLEKATDSYNSAVSSIESRVMVTARKFKELGAGTQTDIPEIPQIEIAPKSISTPEEKESRVLESGI